MLARHVLYGPSMSNMTHSQLARAIAESLDDADMDAKRTTIASAIEIVTAYEMDYADFLASGGDFRALVADVRVARRLAVAS